MTYKFVNGQKIDFGKRIVNPKHLREIVHSAMSAFQGKPGLVLQTSRCVDTDGYTRSIVLALSHGLNIFEVTNCPRQELNMSSTISFGYK